MNTILVMFTSVGIVLLTLNTAQASNNSSKAHQVLIMKKILFTLIAALFILASCGGEKAPVDIINPDAEYLYFYGASCPHCQELNAIAQERDLYSQIPVEKREVWSNPENNQMFQDLIEELEYEGAGVPFVYDKVTGEVAV